MSGSKIINNLKNIPIVYLPDIIIKDNTLILDFEGNASLQFIKDCIKNNDN